MTAFRDGLTFGQLTAEEQRDVLRGCLGRIKAELESPEMAEALATAGEPVYAMRQSQASKSWFVYRDGDLIAVCNSAGEAQQRIDQERRKGL